MLLNMSSRMSRLPTLMTWPQPCMAKVSSTVRPRRLRSLGEDSAFSAAMDDVVGYLGVS